MVAVYTWFFSVSWFSLSLHVMEGLLPGLDYLQDGVW